LTSGDYSFPNVWVDLLHAPDHDPVTGLGDQIFGAVANALDYYAALSGSQKDVLEVEGQVHTLAVKPGGAHEIRDRLLAHCVRRP
jgi:hypothetical protein